MINVKKYLSGTILVENENGKKTNQTLEVASLLGQLALVAILTPVALAILGGMGVTYALVVIAITLAFLVGFLFLKKAEFSALFPVNLDSEAVEAVEAVEEAKK